MTDLRVKLWIELPEKEIEFGDFNVITAMIWENGGPHAMDGKARWGVIMTEKQMAQFKNKLENFYPKAKGTVKDITEFMGFPIKVIREVIR
jgi:hypothetical protein